MIDFTIAYTYKGPILTAQARDSAYRFKFQILANVYTLRLTSPPFTWVLGYDFYNGHLSHYQYHPTIQN